MKKFLNWKLTLILIILLASFLRLWQLGDVPSGIPDDEASYIYNSYSIWETGKDINGKFLPLSFNAHSSQSPVEVYLTAPFVGLLGLSEFSARLPSALLGIGSVFLLFLLTNHLFKSKKIALISAFLFTVSPWALQLQRGLWDADFGLFFMLAGIYFFVVNIHSRKFLWSLIPFLLAFYSYHALKVYFIFLIPVLLFFFKKELLKLKKTTLIFLLGCLIMLGSFWIITNTQLVTRQQEVSIFGNSTAASEVNLERKINIAPGLLRKIFNNKPLYLLRIMRENYLKAFSTEYLFLSGESGNSSQIVNIFFRGELYIIELPFLLLGLYVLIKNKNNFNRNFIFALLLISPLPSTFTTDRNFVARDIMMLPLILIVIACGLDYWLKIVCKYRIGIRNIVLTIFISIYAFLIFGYLYQYYFRWTVYGAESWGKSYKDLVNMVDSKKNNFKNIYISRNPNELLLQYAIFNRVDPQRVQNAWQKKPIQIDNLTLLKECINSSGGYVMDNLPKSTLYAATFIDCHSKDVPTEKILDYGEPLHVIWNIYENN